MGYGWPARRALLAWLLAAACAGGTTSASTTKSLPAETSASSSNGAPFSSSGTNRSSSLSTSGQTSRSSSSSTPAGTTSASETSEASTGSTAESGSSEGSTATSSESSGETVGSTISTTNGSTSGAGSSESTFSSGTIGTTSTSSEGSTAVFSTSTGGSSTSSSSAGASSTSSGSSSSSSTSSGTTSSSSSSGGFSSSSAGGKSTNSSTGSSSGASASSGPPQLLALALPYNKGSASGAFFNYFQPAENLTLPSDPTGQSCSTSADCTDGGSCSGGACEIDQLGYQNGTMLANGWILYPPYQVSTAVQGGSWGEGTPQGALLVYDSTNADNTNVGTPGFAAAANWAAFDTTESGSYTTGGYNGTAVDKGGNVYFVPGASATNPTFIRFAATADGGFPGVVQNAANYEFAVPQRDGGGPIGDVGSTFGWCSAAFDGRFVYFAPNSDSKLLDECTKSGGAAAATTCNYYIGNVLRYDTQQAFEKTVTDAGVPSWSNFDLTTLSGTTCVAEGVSAAGNNVPMDCASGYQTVVYDGYRYVYYVPFHNLLFVRFDSCFGAAAGKACTAPSAAGFQNPSAYSFIDPTTLPACPNPAGACYTPPLYQPASPSDAGPATAANLAYYTGAVTAWNAAGTVEYLYLVPWASYPLTGNDHNPIASSSAARVQIGSCAGGGCGASGQNASSWSLADFTSAGASWEVFDLQTLQNGATAAASGTFGWPAAWPAGPANDTEWGSNVAGFQFAWVNPANANAGGGPTVGLVADAAQYFVEHIVSHSLSDPAGWIVAPIPPKTAKYNYSTGTMGAAFDPVNDLLYPTSYSGNWLFQISGL